MYGFVFLWFYKIFISYLIPHLTQVSFLTKICLMPFVIQNFFTWATELLPKSNHSVKLI